MILMRLSRHCGQISKRIAHYIPHYRSVAASTKGSRGPLLCIFLPLFLSLALYISIVLLTSVMMASMLSRQRLDLSDEGAFLVAFYWSLLTSLGLGTIVFLPPESADDQSYIFLIWAVCLLCFAS